MTWRVESGQPAEAQPASTQDASPAADRSLAAVTSPVPQSEWDQIYHSDPDALPTQSWRWAQALVSTGRFADRSRLYTFDDGRRALVPLFCRVHLGPIPVRLWSQPAAWGFGGVVAEAGLDAAHLSTILSDLEHASLLAIGLRPNPLHAAAWTEAAQRWTRIERCAHVLDLDGGMARVWDNRFKPRTRTAVRKAQAAGMDIVCGRSVDLIAEFYQLFEKSVIRWAGKQREPVPLALWRARRRDPIDKFHRLAEAMGDGFRLWLARHEGQAVAAILVLQDTNAHYTRGAMNEELAGPLSANVLLHHRAIEEACAAGCRSYHMGETGHSEALAQFKSRFGAVAVPYAEYLRERVPVSGLTTGAKTLVKRVIGFRDA
jgi:hypothetical protein